MEILSTSTAKTEELAKTIASKLKAGMVLALYGDLGSGKTTFTAYLVKALGFDSRVQSPTFVIHRQYSYSASPSPTRMSLSRQGGTTDSSDPRSTYNFQTDIQIIHHIDLYRLTSEEEVLDLGLPEMFMQQHSLVLIEWPELAREFLPADVVKLYFTTIDETTRRIVIEGLEI